MRPLFWLGFLLPFLAIAADSLPALTGKQEELTRELAQVTERLRALRRAQREEAARKGLPPEQTQFCIPRLSRPPTIDGTIQNEEWRGAIAVPLVTGLYTSLFLRPGGTFYLGWDADNVYFAQRLPLRPGERPKRLCRAPGTDQVSPMETSVEVWVDRKSNGSHPSPCRWQFMGNASGNRYEREEQYAIGQNFIGWSGQWRFQQSVSPDGRHWDTEIAIPRSTVYQAAPLQEGDVWWLGLATNLQYPHAFSGFYGFKIPATLREASPEIRLRDPQQSLLLPGVAADLAIRNTTPQTLTGEVRVLLTPKQGEPALDKSWPFTLAPGADLALPIREKGPAAGQYSLAIMVLANGKSLYTWAHSIRYDAPEIRTGLEYTPDPNPFVLEAAYNPLADYLRAGVDIFDSPERQKVAQALLAVTGPDGETVATAAVTAFPYGKGQTKIALPAGLATGTYRCEARLADAAGTTLATAATSFERRDPREFPWLDNRIGEADVVAQPFSPLTVAGPVIGAYAKQITLAGSALPEQIVAREVALLRAPIALRGSAAGRPFGLAAEPLPRPGEHSATHADFTGNAAGGPLRVAIATRWEYDSTARYTLELQPAGDTPARFDELQVVIPFSAAAAQSYMATGVNMRLSTTIASLPKKGQEVTAWRATDMPYQEMTVGSFVPFIWIGNRRAGLTWFADSDQGWWPSERRPAAEILAHADGSADLVLNLASEAVTLTGPRRIEFGLNVNPVRAVTPDWPGMVTFGSLTEMGRWDPAKQREPPFARRYPDNIELSRANIATLHQFHELYTPYTEMTAQDFWKPEWEYFREHWDTGSGLGTVFLSESAIDCLLYWSQRWAQEGPIDGFYFDNVFPRLNTNTHAGTAYVLPDGRIQPGYNLWGLREHFKRLRVMFQELRPTARICIHNTRFQFAPIMGFADLAMGGEMATPTGDDPAHRDFMDMHPRDLMDVLYNEPLWGYKLSHLYHFARASYVDADGNPDPAAADLVHRSAQATMAVHGVEFLAGPTWNLLKKIAGGQFEFLSSADTRGLFEVLGEAPDLDAAVYRGANVAIVVVANYSRRQALARVALRLPDLLAAPGPYEQRVVLDLDTLQGTRGVDFETLPARLPEAAFAAKRLSSGGATLLPNTLRIRVNPHDYRAIVIANLPISHGTGF